MESDSDIKDAVLNPELQVAMANDLLKGKSSLSLNSAKLLRTAITQINMYDNELMLYRIGIREFADMLNITHKNLYKEAQKICTQLLKEVVMIGDGNPKHKWQAFQWVSECRYENGYIYIRLHDMLKPYLLGLKKHFTKYELDNILYLKSHYAIRIYELVKGALLGEKIYGDKTADVSIDMETLRKATNTENKYKNVNAFTERVIRVSCDDINRKPFGMHITYTPYKEGHKIAGYTFHVESWSGHVRNQKKMTEDDGYIEEDTEESSSDEEIAGQMSIYDFGGKED